MHTKGLALFIFALFAISVVAFGQSPQIPKVKVEIEVDPAAVVENADIMPAYPNGDNELLRFVAENVEYPPICKENGITGVVYVQYVVDVDGQVKNVKVIRGADPFLDAEASRVVKTISGYKPGSHKGKPVPVQFTIPIRFVLDGPKELKDNTESNATKPEIVYPAYPGGDSAIFNLINSQITYPPIARENDIEGHVQLVFKIDTMGRIIDLQVAHDPDPFLTKESKRLIKLLTNFSAGSVNGKLEQFEYGATFDYNLKAGGKRNGVNLIITNATLSFFGPAKLASTYKIVEIMPEYPGGDGELLMTIARNTNYPLDAKNAGITGVVYVSYVVAADGSVRDVKVVKGAHQSLDAEAVRVVKLLKGYKPGMQDGKPVPVQFTIPLRFVLNDPMRPDRYINPEAEKAFSEGVRAFHSGDFVLAIKNFNNSIRLDPYNHVSVYHRAVTKYNLKQYEGAELDFAKVLKMVPNGHLNTYLTRGEMRSENKQFKYAIQDFDKALILDKKSYDALIGKGRCLTSMEEYEEAAKIFRKATKTNPDEEAPHLYTGALFLSIKSFKKAIQSFTKAIELNSENGKSYYQRGMCHARLRDMESACLDWTKAKELGIKEVEMLVETQCKGEE